MHRQETLSNHLSGRDRARIERYMSEEIDPEDHTGFLYVCQMLGITEKSSIEYDSEIVELFHLLSSLSQEYGLCFTYDFATALTETKEREEMERIDKENDLLEIELMHSTGSASISLKRSRIEELQIEKIELLKKLEKILEIEKVSSISLEIVELAKSLSMCTEEREGGEYTLAPLSTCSEEFYSFFLPFLSLSVESVIFLYSQIRVDEKENKEEVVKSHLEMLSLLHSLRSAKESATDIKQKIEYGIIELLQQKKVCTITDICTSLHIPRENVIEQIFLLCSKQLILFDRKEDTTRMCI